MSCKGLKPSSNPRALVFQATGLHGIHMRIVSLLMLVSAACLAESAFGTWKMNPARSTFSGDTQPRSLTVRIEPHAKGEVFTLDRIEADGRTTSSSTILYFDGAPRAFQH